MAPRGLHFSARACATDCVLYVLLLNGEGIRVHANGACAGIKVSQNCVRDQDKLCE